MGRPDLAVGTVLDERFRIVDKVGAGTTGVVYEVEHVLTRHRRALKLLDPSLRDHAETFARFRREASIAARLRDPHVVEVHDAGELPEGYAYVLMELLEGESLQALLSRRAPLPIGELASLIRDAARGLHAAHEAGIVHRDVKPANLFLTPSGVKVLDFGICQFDPDLTQLELETQNPRAMGTPAYMAPEQVRGGRELDRRVDVWALGVMLYVGATGARPFRATSLSELAIAIDRDQRTPLSESAPNLDPQFAAVIERAMAHARDSRYPTAAALAEALDPFVGRSDQATLDPRESATLDPTALITAPSERPKPREPPAAERSARPWAMLVALPVLGFASYFVLRAPSPAPAAVVAPPLSSPSAAPCVVTSSAPSAVPSPQPSIASARPSAAPPPVVPLHRTNPYQ